MVRYVGNADIPGVCLKYFVFGNRRCGYSIRITEESGGCEHCYVSSKLSEVLDLAYKLRKCSVFPENLREILEDLQFVKAESETC